MARLNRRDSTATEGVPPRDVPQRTGDAPRAEYPRPQFHRERWANLNGEWSFAFDDADAGLGERWQDTGIDDLGQPPFDRHVVVPYCYQSALSGIGDTTLHDVVWYARGFDRPDAAPEQDRVHLHFGAVDYWATVWVNGILVARHEGGHTPFSADVTPALRDTGNVLVVRAEDPSQDLTIPRGKQYWKEETEGIFYTPTTGIWQTVWLEPVSAAHVRELRITPDVDRASVDVEVAVAGAYEDLSVRLTGSFDGKAIFSDLVGLQGKAVRRSLPVVQSRFLPTTPRVRRWHKPALWSPEQPNLHDLRVELVDPSGRVIDTVESYFGMRKIETRDGQVYLNNRPYYQRLVLDQGYFPGGLLTAPADDDLRRDIELAKELGFNGARKHQKVEDPRWLYWADRLGFLVWGEMANAYQFSPDYVARMTGEWQAAVRRDYNHPCIVAWVPMNESWGVPELASDPAQVAHLVSLYHLTRSLDRSRLVVSNDGWEHAVTDLLTLHAYVPAKGLRKRYRTVSASVGSRPGGLSAYVPGHAHRGEPILITEFGGVALDTGADSGGGWGYQKAKDHEQLAERYAAQVGALLDSDAVQGFCYTQLTDVQQEINGLLTYDRKPKVDPARIRASTTGKGR